MEDYDDVREALKLVPGGDVGWQVTQTRLAVSLLTALAQSLDRRICELETLTSKLEAALTTMYAKPAEPPADPDAWKTKAVTVIVWGALALIGGALVTFIEHIAELRLHIGS